MAKALKSKVPLMLRKSVEIILQSQVREEVRHAEGDTNCPYLACINTGASTQPSWCSTESALFSESKKKRDGVFYDN